MGRQNDINFLKAAGILVSVIIVFASLIIYSLNDNRTPHYSPSKTAVGQEQGQGEQDNSSNESDMAVNNISELSLPELFSKVEKSVVQVANKEEAGIMIGERLGSGFVYDKSGHIVTNYHVIAGGATEGNVQITFLDGSTYNARLVGGDPFSDLAVLQLEGENIPEEKLIPLPIGDSTSLRVGEQIVAIGNPFGLSGSMTEGIVSGLGRMIPSSPEIADVLGLAEARGFLVTDVTPASPAQKAGIQGGNGGDSLTTIGGREMKIGGDVILKIDDRTVRKIDDMLTYLEREKKVGDTVQFTVLRNGGTENIKLTLDPRPSQQQQISESQPQSRTLPPQEGT